MKRTTHALVAALATSLALSACGGSSSSDQLSAESSSTSSDDFATAGADAQAAAAAEAAAGLETVHITGYITLADQSVIINVSVSTSGDCAGSVGLEGGFTEVLSVGGESWFRPSKGVWRAWAASPAQAREIIAVVGDEWVVRGAGFDAFCDLDALLGAIGDEEMDWEAGEETDVNGTPAIAIESTDAGGETSTGYVATAEPHYPLRLEKPDGDVTFDLSLSEFDESLDVDAPAAEQITDLDELVGDPLGLA